MACLARGPRAVRPSVSALFCRILDPERCFVVAGGSAGLECLALKGAPAIDGKLKALPSPVTCHL